MEEKSNLYIVAIVGIIAVVALVIMVTGARQSVVTLPNTLTTDETGQVYLAPPDGASGGSITLVPGQIYGFVFGLTTAVCTDSDSREIDTETIGLSYKYKGTASMLGQSYTDTCMVDNTVVSSCTQAIQAGSPICYLKEYYCDRPWIKMYQGIFLVKKWVPGNQYSLKYTKIPTSTCSNGASPSR